MYTLAAGLGIERSLKPVADSLQGLNLPEALIHWGHPANMAVVLFAMGGYGSYLGWQIRTSDDADTIIMAKQMHPKVSNFNVDASGKNDVCHILIVPTEQG